MAIAWKELFGVHTPRRPDLVNEDLVSQMELLSEPSGLLCLHAQRLNALRLESGLAAKLFEELIVSALCQVAEYVHLLPATRAEHHIEPGGLFRWCVESACLAFRCADNKFLGPGDSTPLKNRERERIRRYATFLGGLLAPIGQCATHVRVCVHGGKPSVEKTWDAYREPLWPWAKRVKAYKLDVQWLTADPKSTQAAAVWIAARIVPQPILNHLHSAGEPLAEKLLRILAGEPPAGRLEEIVRNACQTAIDQDLLKTGNGPAPVLEIPATGGRPVEPAALPQVAVRETVKAAHAPQAPLEIVREAAPPEPKHPVAAAAVATDEFTVLNRFGDAGQVLKALAQHLRSDNTGAQVVAVEEGVAIAYPDAIAPFCRQPQQFLLACESQGLLIADNVRRKSVRTRTAGQNHLPEHYIVLGPRVAKHLPVRMPADGGPSVGPAANGLA